MRVVCPFTDLAPETDAALSRYAPHAERVELDPEDAYAYHGLVARLWADGESFCVIEHDIEIVSGVIGGFDRCAAPWCAHRYRYPIGGSIIGFGCVRFRASLLRDTADLLDTPRGWRWLGSSIMRRLARRGYHPCTHAPILDHHRAPLLDIPEILRPAWLPQTSTL